MLQKRAGAQKWPPQKLRTYLRLLESDELRHGRGDGVVTLRRARAPNSNSYREFDVNHLGIHRPPADNPEQYPVFQWIIEVLQWKAAAGIRP